MSVIVAVSDGLKVCMAADSQLTNGSTRTVLANSKLMRVGPLVIGVDGLLAAGDALRYHSDELELRNRDRIQSLPAWCSQTFVPWFRAYLKAADLMEKAEDGRLEFPCAALVAYRGQFVHMDIAGAVNEIAQSWWAIGSGAAVARGAMWALETGGGFGRGDMGYSPKLLAHQGVRAAIAFDIQCCDPVVDLYTEA